MVIRPVRFGWLLLFVVAAWLPPLDCFAAGEVFKLESSGTEYCGHFNVTKFSAKTDIDLWVRIDSTEQLTVSLSPYFEADLSFPLFGQTYDVASGKSAFIGGVAFDDGSYVTIQGTASWDKNTGAVKGLSGTFIQDSVFWIGCFSSGKVKTTVRL
jgi:hypothetical protein